MKNNSNIKESLNDMKKFISMEIERTKYYKTLQHIKEYCINNIDDDNCVKIKAMIEKEI